MLKSKKLDEQAKKLIEIQRSLEALELKKQEALAMCIEDEDNDNGGKASMGKDKLRAVKDAVEIAEHQFERQFEKGIDIAREELAAAKKAIPKRLKELDEKREEMFEDLGLTGARFEILWVSLGFGSLNLADRLFPSAYNPKMFANTPEGLARVAIEKSRKNEHEVFDLRAELSRLHQLWSQDETASALSALVKKAMYRK